MKKNIIRQMLSFQNLSSILSILFLGLAEDIRYSFLALPAFLLLVLVFLFSNEVKHIYLFVALIPFYKLLSVGNIGVGFILCLLASYRLISKYGGKFNKGHGVISMLIILVVLFANELFATTIGTIINSLSVLLYFGCFSVLFPKQLIRTSDLTCILLGSLLLVLVMIIYHAGGNFLSVALSDEISRLGEANIDNGFRNALGGAMGLPIYAILVISILIGQITKNSKYNKYLLALMFVVAIIPFFTISRVYILGLSSIFLFFSCYAMTSVKSFIKMTSVIVMMTIVIIVFAMLNTAYVDAIVDKYIYRSTASEGGISTGRFDIYIACLKHLLGSPKALLFGEGIRGYLQAGGSNSLLSMSAHNLYLDAIMSFGLIGCLCLVRLCYIMVSQLKKFSNRFNLSPFRFLPLFSYMVMVNTGGSFADFKTYLYIIFLLIYAFKYENLINPSSIQR